MKSRHLVGQTVCASKRVHHRSTQHSRFDFSGKRTHTHRRHLVGQIFEPRDVIFNTVYSAKIYVKKVFFSLKEETKQAINRLKALT